MAVPRRVDGPAHCPHPHRALQLTLQWRRDVIPIMKWSVIYEPLLTFGFSRAFWADASLELVENMFRLVHILPVLLIDILSCCSHCVKKKK